MATQELTSDQLRADHRDEDHILSRPIIIGALRWEILAYFGLIVISLLVSLIVWILRR